jgi:hypothetical protein
MSIKHDEFDRRSRRRFRRMAMASPALFEATPYGRRLVGGRARHLHVLRKVAFTIIGLIWSQLRRLRRRTAGSDHLR